jgi:ABC-type maltose transport system permease subunit
MPEFSFAMVSDSEIGDAVRYIRSDAAGIDGITLSFIKLLLPVDLPVLTYFFTNIFAISWEVEDFCGVAISKNQ